MDLRLIFVLACICSAISALYPVQKPSLKAILNKIPKQSFNEIADIKAANPDDLTFDCAICGIVINELEGLLLENVTETEVTEKLTQDLCNILSGELKTICMTTVNTIPDIFKMLTQQWTISRICYEIGQCAPFKTHVDPSPVNIHFINLDLAPEDRYTEVCSVPSFKTNINFLVDTVTKLLGDVAPVISDLGDALNYFYFPTELAAEIRGCAKQVGVSPGWLSLFNLGYELTDACTSIVAQGKDGTIYHGRNMDFWAGMGFTDTLKDIAYEAHYQRNNETLFKTTTFAGYVGVLSGQKPGEFSVSVNTRNYPGGIKQLFYEAVAAIEEKNASLVTFLTRHVLQNENDFPAAVDQLSKDMLIADVYYTIGGKSPGQGTVLSRNRNDTSNHPWVLGDEPGKWYLLQTNYDHWNPAPWWDDRRVPGNYHMEALGQDNINAKSMMKILEEKPTLNLQTTFSMISVPKTGQYASTTRWCPYPCVQ